MNGWRVALLPMDGGVDGDGEGLRKRRKKTMMMTRRRKMGAEYDGVGVGVVVGGGVAVNEVNSMKVAGDDILLNGELNLYLMVALKKMMMN